MVTELEVENVDPFDPATLAARYRKQAQAMNTGPMVTPLKYAKGAWSIKTSTPPYSADMTDKRLLALPLHATRGWTKWEDRMPVDRAVVYYKDGMDPPERDTLGDYDEDKWPLSPRGTPRDPWVLESHLPFIDPESGMLFQYSTSSRGGISAIGSVFRAYADHIESYQDVNEFPLCGLSTDSYMHKEYGSVDTPLLEILDWQHVPSDRKLPAFVPSTPRLVIPRPTAQLLEGPKAQTPLAKDIDDEIPF
jgi:hypothetical protein